MIEKDLLHRRRCDDLAFRVALGYALDGANALAVEEMRLGDAARHLRARVVLLVPDHHAGMADAVAAAEARAQAAELPSPRRGTDERRHQFTCMV
jgi:hypothetical protein